nr:MAG TPA: hypothetical protein [Caudoviricetes sp.]
MVSISDQSRPSPFLLFICFSFFFIIKNMRNNNINKIDREGDW